MVKLSMYLINYAQRHEDIWGSGGINLRFLTSPLDGIDLSASCPGSFTREDRAPGTHWTEGWVGSRAGLDSAK
jgi:hypothetical protein